MRKAILLLRKVQVTIMIDERSIEGFNTLRNQISNCKKCYKESNSPIIDYINKDIKYIIINEIPAVDNGNIHRTLSGPIRKVLKESFALAGFDLDDFYFTNIIKCSNKNSICSTDRKIDNCKGYLSMEIKILKPIGIFTLGHHVLSIFNTKRNMLQKEDHESIFYNDIPIYHLPHPWKSLISIAALNDFQDKIRHIKNKILE